MGKLLLIVVLVASGIFGIYMLTTQAKTAQMPDVVSDNHMKLQARNVGEYAINYGIYDIYPPGPGTIEAAGPGGIQKIYNDTFLVAEKGSIDKITLSDIDPVPDQFLIKIDAEVTWHELDTVYEHNSVAVVYVDVDEFYTDIYGFITTGSITYRGKGEITGSIQDSSDIIFYDIFHHDKEFMRDLAIRTTSYYESDMIDHNDHETGQYTWIEGDFHPTSQWYGSGLMIITGDLKANYVNFRGLLIVLGEYEVVSHAEIEGAVVVLGDEECMIKAQSETVQNDALIDSILTDFTFNVKNSTYWKE